ncbi:hypothetical protein HQ533_03390 [Candidatus Woesearchaeota archaeon]|nr:hypothetical protein [Candidatus Woesearchaeota archaeon]
MFNINDFWRETVNLAYNREKYTEEFISSILTPNNITKNDLIWDVSAGTGFLSLDLLERGYNVIFSDGDSDMIKQFAQEAERIGLEAESKLIHWEYLLEKYNKQPKLIINRGNSLGYAATWRKEGFDARESYTQVMNALNNFYKLLQPEGFLIQDCVKKGDEEHFYEFGTMTLEGKTCELEWERKSFPEEERSEWTIILRSHDKERQIMNNSYNITGESLTGMLEETGFRNIEPVNLETEQLYKAYLARK